MADVAIVSANLGGFDDVFPQTRQDIDCDWIYYTDGVEPEGWDVRRHQANGDPCLAAKTYKMVPPVPHRYVIWIDGNISISAPSFVREALTYIRGGVALHTHPFRDCIFAEAVETILTPKYDALPIAEQVRHYNRVDKYHPHAGLFACGVIAWDRHNQKAKRMGTAWLAECQRWGFQDQLSCPVVCKRLRIKPGVFPHNQYESPWFQIEKHR